MNRPNQRPPRIGISMRSLPADPHGLGAARAAGWWMHGALLQACANISAEAWPMPPLAGGPSGADARSRIDFLDALILGGGGDLAVDALGFRAPPDEQPLRDQHEYALLDAALSRGIPVLGICRGAQLLQLAAGGALQAPAGAAETPTIHCDRSSYLQHRHLIELRPGGLLSGKDAPRDFTVNSAHRWTIRELAPGLRAEAACPIDGTIEAFSSAEQCLLGTLWHPEFDDHERPDEVRTHAEPKRPDKVLTHAELAAFPGRDLFKTFLALINAAGTAAAAR